MIDPAAAEEPIVISVDDARGAEGPRSGTVSDTLLPMLIWVIVLTAVGVAVVVFATIGRTQ